MSTTDRRDFLKTGAVAGAAAAAVSLIPTAVHAAGNDVIKVGLIGCGGRGSGAIHDSLEADKSTQLFAVADFFEDRAKGAVSNLQKKQADRVNVGERVFHGLNGYKQLLESGVDLVILATPPGFRPVHLEAAVKANKHIFCEKPVAVDGPGIKKCLELVEESKKNGKAVVAGTQRRHQAGYIETIKQIKDGAIGDIVSARCAWNNNGIWFNARNGSEADVAYQIRNWYHYLWLCGDHIVEQHVHNLDVINWVMGAHPVKAVALGGRGFGRKSGAPEEVGNIWDHFAVEFEYPNGVPLYSYCAHVPGIVSDVSETVYGSKGRSHVNRYSIGKKRVFEGTEINPYVQEHIDLIQSIKAGKPLNELQSVTESTMTAILGRTAAYSGQVVTWDQMLKSTNSTMPDGLTEQTALKVPPVPVPGKYKV
ncbi:Gfo/Idh/MocA family protein [Fimbriiglobus ruber]|uniref:Myo-inositol 2-dehydrogenase n=1 Tax=Fimbriiglobus ruber TaxID=1908690 RepID=A0A225D573_9BACT|nr:Gfo/Idh/MocA family oxidoreductase [Fimbriiglobus ruber]OWK36103.1 Myo-inositol 2-dehydrogenase [Fimbriiglobus ruber]